MQLMAFQPAQRFGLKNDTGIHKGQITEGADADLIIFNPKSTYSLRGDSLHSKSKFTPFEDWKVTGEVHRTLLRGTTIYLEGQLIDHPKKNKLGQLLPRC